ncbi:MAG TPA: hypothetical protein VFU69_06980 [Ktedonobacterales bacterium]|nr:hypothetical protein [Ktedonobacterales bacterium]
MAISSEQPLTAHPATSLPFDVAGHMPPWRPTPAFWLRRLSIALALILIALVYFITPTLMRDGPSMQAAGVAGVDNRCASSSASQNSPIGAGVCVLIVQFPQGGAAHEARLQQAAPFPGSLTTLLVTYHQRSLLGFTGLGHLVVTRIAAPDGQAFTEQGTQIIADAQTQLPPGLPQAVALVILLAGLFTFFYPWPVWKVRVNAEVVAMRQIEFHNAERLPVKRSLATLGWQTNRPMQHEVHIPGKLYRRLRPGDHVILTYEHLRSGAFKALRVHLPGSHKGWLVPGVIQVGALTPWRWRWLVIGLLWLEIPLSLLLLTKIS